MKTKSILLLSLLAVMPLAACAGGSNSSTPASSLITSTEDPTTTTSEDPYTYTIDEIKITAVNLQYDFRIIEKAGEKKVKNIKYYKIGDNFMKVCEEEVNKTTYFKKDGAKFKTWTSTKKPDEITATSDWTVSTDSQTTTANGSIDLLPAATGKKYKLNSTKSASFKIVLDGVTDTSLTTKHYDNEDKQSAVYWYDGTDFGMPLMDYDANYRTLLDVIDHRVTAFPTSKLPE